MIKNLIKSIWAGIAIAIGAMVYVNVGGVAGAVLFSIGLLTVFTLGLNLYTGQVGFYSKPADLLDYLLCLLGNLIGTAFALLLPKDMVSDLAAAKLALPIGIVFLKAFLCGTLIYIAVIAYRRSQWYITPFAVASFILCGAEHCIADACYFIGARIFTLQTVGFLLVTILGNAAGAILLNQSLLYCKKNDIIK